MLVAATGQFLLHALQTPTFLEGLFMHDRHCCASIESTGVSHVPARLAMLWNPIRFFLFFFLGINFETNRLVMKVRFFFPPKCNGSCYRKCAVLVFIFSLRWFVRSFSATTNSKHN